jgi:hypothetical protein
MSLAADLAIRAAEVLHSNERQVAADMLLCRAERLLAASGSIDGTRLRHDITAYFGGRHKPHLCVPTGECMLRQR